LQSSNSVIIKGVREGLLLILDDDVPFAQVLTELSERVGTRPDFFKGAGVTMNAGRRVMDWPDFEVIYKMLTRNGMHVHTFVSLSAQSRMVAESFGVASRPPSFAAGDAGGSLGLKARGSALHGQAPVSGLDSAASVAEAGEGIFLRCNLRPGQSVRYAGDVCVLGDVESGAEIVADGDIVVWGALLGTVHAGANGDDEAIICALHLSPIQLGIAGYISRFPANEEGYQGTRPPELAHVEMGRIVVEAWAERGREDYSDQQP
jgi:septum site-determining protein MinC